MVQLAKSCNLFFCRQGSGQVPSSSAAGVSDSTSQSLQQVQANCSRLSSQLQVANQELHELREVQPLSLSVAKCVSQGLSYSWKSDVRSVWTSAHTAERGAQQPCSFCTAGSSKLIHFKALSLCVASDFETSPHVIPRLSCSNYQPY